MSAIILFEEKQVRRAWNKDKEKWYFAIADVIAVLTGSVDPGASFFRRSFSQTVTDCHGLKMTAADGRQRLTDVANTEQLLRLIQSIPSPKAEPFEKRLRGIAGNARRELESKSGTKVSTKANFKELPEVKTRTLRKGKQGE